jgi:hypothetical protein
MYFQVNKWFETARCQARGASAETPNWRRRGRPPMKNANQEVPYTPNSAMNAQNLPFNNFGMTTLTSTINAQKSPSRSVGMTTPNSAVNGQKTAPASIGTSKSTSISKDFMDSERKKAIMRELRKQKMGR